MPSSEVVLKIATTLTISVSMWINFVAISTGTSIPYVWIRNQDDVTIMQQSGEKSGYMTAQSGWMYVRTGQTITYTINGDGGNIYLAHPLS